LKEYLYSGKNADGEVQKGSIEAESEEGAAKYLNDHHIFPIHIYEKNKSGLSRLAIFSHVSSKEKVFFIRQLATTINAGLPVSQALVTLSSESGKGALEDIITQIVRDVGGGSTLSDAFAKYPKVFSTIDITLIRAGESSGSLDVVLLRLADSTENEYKIASKIRGAMVYPIFVLVLIMGVLVVMNYYVLPKMKDLYASFNGAKLPAVTQGLMAVNQFSTQYWYIMIILLVGFVVAARWYLSTSIGRFQYDHFKLIVPAFGKFFRSVYMGRFTRTLAGLIGSGVSILDALRIVTNATGNVVIAEEIKKCIPKVKSGTPLSKPLKESPYFPPIVSQMVKIGEETGEIDKMLTNLAEYFEDDVSSFVSAITSVMEPFIIITLAVIVGFILIAVMLPIYQFGSVL